MKTKVRLNCYFFSNLIVGLLALNFLYSGEKTLVEVKKDGGKLEPIYVIAEPIVLEKEEIKEVKEDKEEVITAVSVTKKTLASKKVINYVKPSYNSVTGTNLVNYAKHYLGLPYISAGRSLEQGTDCSGFTRLIFREFGINLGTTVASQIYSGSYVSKSDLEPGDLVFYGYSTKATHVAIYIGGGQIIHESNPRDGVKISPVNIMVYITARRLITKNVVKEEKEVKTSVLSTEEVTPKEEVKEEEKKLEEVKPDNKVEVLDKKEEEKTEIDSKEDKEKVETEIPLKEEVKIEEEKIEPQEEIKPPVQEEVKEEPQEETKEVVEESKVTEPLKEEVTKEEKKEEKQEEKLEEKPEVPISKTSSQEETPIIEENNDSNNSINNIEEAEKSIETEK